MAQDWLWPFPRARKTGRCQQISPSLTQTERFQTNSGWKDFPGLFLLSLSLLGSLVPPVWKDSAKRTSLLAQVPPRASLDDLSSSDLRYLPGTSFIHIVLGSWSWTLGVPVLVLSFDSILGTPSWVCTHVVGSFGQIDFTSCCFLLCQV